MEQRPFVLICVHITRVELYCVVLTPALIISRQPFQSTNPPASIPSTFSTAFCAVNHHICPTAFVLHCNGTSARLFCSWASRRARPFSHQGQQRVAMTKRLAAGTRPGAAVLGPAVAAGAEVPEAWRSIGWWIRCSRVARAWDEPRTGARGSFEWQPGEVREDPIHSRMTYRSETVRCRGCHSSLAKPSAISAQQS